MATPKLAELLVSKGLVNETQLTSALEHQTKTKMRLASSLVNLGHVNERVLASFLSQQYGIPAITLADVTVNDELKKILPQNVCEKHTIIPIALQGKKLSLAIIDPTNVSAIDDVRFLTNREVELFLAPESAVKKLIEKTFSGSTIENLGKSVEMFKVDEKANPAQSLEVKSSIGESFTVENAKGNEDKPVIRLINTLFLEAMKRKASDIHIEPYDTHSRVRFRIDGSLHEIMRLPPQLKAATPSRIKVMAQLDISEKRKPQDGRIQVKTKDRQIDVRVSILPTLFGEKVVLRLLDQGTSAPSLLEMGFEEEQLKVFRQASSEPYGMVLVTGPTGSGKTTTLYGILTELNQTDSNISTVEDPVEYNMPGVNQVQVKEAIGMTFAMALRSLLRQDPDIIMLGEIRDQETAEIAVKAALTGHMVFSTVHTNDAPSTVTRLVHMGVEPFLITAALTLVQAQRLVRMICPNCAEPDKDISRETLLSLEMPEEWIETFKPVRGRGCDACGNTGFKGRKGIFEVMPMSEKIRNHVVKGATSDMIKRTAMEEGMYTLRQSALMKLYKGETTIEEVLNNSRPDGEILR